MSLPVILFSFVFTRAEKQLAFQMGLMIAQRNGKLVTGVTGGIYLALLTVALLMAKTVRLSIVYQWIYYLIFVAFTEKLVFCGMLPWLIEKSGLPEWCVWVVPGILFAARHILIPVIQFGLSVGLFLMQLLLCLSGYTLSGCMFYGLCR